MAFDWILAAGMALSAVLAAVGAVLILAALQAGSRPAAHGFFNDDAGDVTFLFDGDALVDATPGGRTILSLGPQIGTPFARLVAHLSERFPTISDRLSHLAEDGHFILSGAEVGGVVSCHLLDAELRGGLTRISLLANGVSDRTHDSLSYNAMGHELATLRTTVSRAPYLIWREDAADRVIWANAAYLMEAAEHLPADQDLTWPLPRLFERAVSVEATSGQRLYLERADRGRRWYDVRTVPDDQGRLSFALPADAVVQAEGSLRGFMQTLTKTFAHLPTGLAIFDRQRQLQLFNPALVDLCGLQPDFLSMRPTLFAFLDAMRDGNMIPEPKDYRGWRKKMSELERAASTGLYEETWSLPSGQTYRVIGRPHPNGALALMFDDISTETLRTRRYRADIELGQAVIDAMEDAVAVFAPSGALVMINAAYVDLWGHDPATTLADTGITRLSARWRAHSGPTQLWADAEAFLTTVGARDACCGDVRLLDGRLVACSFKDLQGGATMASFRPIQHGVPQADIAQSQSRKLA
jgi:PAS domain-containing protein